MPAVGDYAKYKVKVTVNGHVDFEGYETHELKSFDPTTGNFLEVVKNGGALTERGRYEITKITKNHVAAEDLATDDYLKEIISSCVDFYEGKIIKIKIAGREIETCQQNIQGADGISGLGYVPFGWTFFKYSMVFENGTRYEVEQRLVKFKN